ncbi:MAG: hypothetical protein WBW38_14065, partial [Candidatus Sulfotelmatobacter sp.]
DVRVLGDVGDKRMVEDFHIRCKQRESLINDFVCAAKLADFTVPAEAGVAAILHKVRSFSLQRDHLLEWLGSLATYGFIVAYALVCVALPRYLREHGAFRPGAQLVPWLAGLAMLLALVGNFYPVPEGPYGKLPYIYLAYLTAGLLWFAVRGRSKDEALAEG